MHLNICSRLKKQKAFLGQKNNCGEIRVNIMTITVFFKYEPRHEISNNVVCATSKASDQPSHMRSLIRAFASRLNILLLLGYCLIII